jgi:hypothetical protein
VTSNLELAIEGQSVQPTADYALRFVEREEGGVRPALYYRGRRVIQSWSLALAHEQPADDWGISG